METVFNYWQEFLLLASAHALAVISPGPDFALVMRQSLVFGRKTAIYTSCGIGCAIAVHLAYSLLGLELLQQSSSSLFRAIQIAGALYLAYIGWQALGSSRKQAQTDSAKAFKPSLSFGVAFRQGFITNALNPKATAFFLFLFTSVVSTQTPLSISLLYGVWMVVMTALWFILLSVILSQAKVRGFFANFGHWLDRSLGLLLIGLALAIIVLPLF